MADALKSNLVEVTYIDGEQPTSIKLTNSVSQLKVAVEKINKAIGDIYSQYSTSANLQELPLVGPNLGRSVGSMAWLNPKRIGRIRTTKEVVFQARKENFEDYENYQYTTFRLPFPPILYRPADGSDTDIGTDVWLHLTNDSSTFTNNTNFKTCMEDPDSRTYSWSWENTNGATTYWSIGAPGGGIGDDSALLATRVDKLSELNANGEYHVSEDGIITVYQGISYLSGFKVTYTFDTIPDSYDGASFNVIPDFEETTTLCTVAQVSGTTYSITLPTTTETRGLNGTYWNGDVTLNQAGITYSTDVTAITNMINDMNTWHSISSTSNPMYSYQHTLPYRITENFSKDEVIPAGYIEIWDETTQSIIGGTTFTYQNSTQVYCQGVTLTASTNRYRLVVPGTDLARTLYKLRHDYDSHEHTGHFSKHDLRFDGKRISHAYCLDNIDGGTGTLYHEGFFLSTAGPHRNPHPQYLHRYGYQYGTSLADTKNRDNSLLGDLVLSTISNKTDGTLDSHAIYFGGDPTKTVPKLWFDYSESTLVLDNNPVQVNKTIADTVTPTVNGIYGNTVIAASGFISLLAGNFLYTQCFNIDVSSLSISADNIVVPFRRNMLNTSYVVLLGSNFDATNDSVWVVVQKNEADVRLAAIDTTTGDKVSLSGANVSGCNLAIIGNVA